MLDMRDGGVLDLPGALFELRLEISAASTLLRHTVAAALSVSLALVVVPVAFTHAGEASRK